MTSSLPRSSADLPGGVPSPPGAAADYLDELSPLSPKDHGSREGVHEVQVGVEDEGGSNKTSLDAQEDGYGPGDKPAEEEDKGLAREHSREFHDPDMRHMWSEF